ncbi:hypothetical protein M758_1G192700 [Ceratodon purpureus]|nr:hypothetical protein M758_1G192700 [Ceratodon purpureus]
MGNTSRAAIILAHELVFLDLLDSVIVDVATEAHRGAKLGLDPRLDHDDEADQAQLLAHARAVGSVDVDVTGSETGKHAVDVFGASHPAIANETLDCMNCGRPIVAGRFAPHLEKCMGKGRKSRPKLNSTAEPILQRRGRPSKLVTNRGPILNDIVKQTRVQSPVQSPRSTTGISQQSSMDADNAHSIISHTNRILSPDRLPSVKARTKNMKKKVVIGIIAPTSTDENPSRSDDQVSSVPLNPQASTHGTVSQLVLSTCR